MTAREIGCQECGKPVSERRDGAQFCCAPCRMKYNNRIRDRGADAYHLLRAMRRERDKVKKLGIWTELCRLELKWQEEDERDRPGRRSYVAPERAIANLKDKGALPRGELLVRSHFNGRKPAARSEQPHPQ